jgi:hypothetical protein
MNAVAVTSGAAVKVTTMVAVTVGDKRTELGRAWTTRVFAVDVGWEPNVSRLDTNPV